MQRHAALLAQEGLALASRCLCSIGTSLQASTSAPIYNSIQGVHAWQPARHYAQASSLTAAADAAAGSASKADKGKSGKGSGPKGGAAAAAPKAVQAGSSQGSSSQSDALLDPGYQFRHNRLLGLYQGGLMREMLLKMGAPRTWTAAPRIHAITLTIDVRQDTRMDAEVADKKDLLLYCVALEHIAGVRPGFLAPDSRKSTTTARGVSVTVTGSRALEVLEKLVLMVLPNQMSFEGLPPATKLEPVAGQPEDQTLYALDLKVDNLLLYPDFEHNFDLFEPLRSMQVRVVVDRAPSADMARVFVGGFGLPLQSS